MAADKVLAMHLYQVHTANGTSNGAIDVVAAYVRTEGGFLEFKNAAHEVVLMVNANHVVSVGRSFAPVAESRLAGGGSSALKVPIVPPSYWVDAQGNTSRDSEGLYMVGEAEPPFRTPGLDVLKTAPVREVPC